MNTLVNTVFKSKMKTANTRFEDKYQKIKKCGNARKARLSDDLKTIMRGSTLCTTCGVPTGTFSQMRDVDVNRLLVSRSLESTESSPKNRTY